MPAQVKTEDNLTKHLTKAEREARQQAEAAVLPDRPVVWKIPTSLTKDPTAKKYWKSILGRMEGLAILDSLDAEIFAVYCAALSRRDSFQALYRDLMAQMKDEEDPNVRLELTDKLDSLVGKIQNHDKLLLQFADKLGLTPEARVRLARKRAAQVEVTPEDDLYGD